MTNWYHRKLNLKYNKNVFDEIIEYGNSHTWDEGIDKNGVLWNIHELPLDMNTFPILKEIYSAINFEFKKPRFYISSVPAGGLPNHIDHQKWGNLGFPLIGDFASSPQYYYDQFNHPVESFVLDSPVIFNTRMLHGVPRAKTDTSKRWILMLEVYDWIDHVFKKVDAGTIWNNTEHFTYA